MIKAPAVIVALVLTAPAASAQIAFVDVSNSAAVGKTNAETWGVAWADVDGGSAGRLYRLPQGGSAVVVPR